MDQQSPLQQFANAAQAAPSLWRLLAAIAVIAVGLLLTGLAIGALALAFDFASADIVSGFETPLSALIFLASFLIWRPAIWVAMRLFCQRPYRTVFGPTGRVNVSQFLNGLFIAALFATLSTVIAWLLVGAPVISAPSVMMWLGFAVIAIPLVYFQSSAEELLFRGLILQHMAARFSAFWAWALAPSLLFGLLHWQPDGYGPGAWMVLCVTGVTGLAFALITAATGNLGLAMGLHFGLNVFALLLIAPNDQFAGLALAYWPLDDDQFLKLLTIDLAAVTFGCFIAGWMYKRSQLSP